MRKYHSESASGRVRSARSASHLDLLERRCLFSAGSLDTTFGAGGISGGALYSGNAFATAVLANGKILAAGSAGYGSTSEFALGQFNADGSPDRTFGSAGAVLTTVGGFSGATSMAVQADGKIVVGGTADDSLAVVRYLPSGALDTTFGSHGIVILPRPLLETASASLALQPDGKIVIAGTTRGDANTSNSNQFALVRLTSTGALDARFGVDGLVTTTRVAGGNYFGAELNALVIEQDGKIVAAGSSYEHVAVVRYLSNGSLDATFGDHGIVVDQQVQSPSPPAALAVQHDGKILLDSLNGDGVLEVVRYGMTGTLDRTFGRGGAVLLAGDPTTKASPLVTITNGGILVVQTRAPRAEMTPLSYLQVTRLTSTGAIDQSYGTSGAVTVTPARSGFHGNAAALQADRKLVVTGGGVGGVAVLRLTADGRLDDTFAYHGLSQEANGLSGGINAIAVQPDGKILAAGSELSPDPATRPTDAAVIRYNADGSLDPTFGVSGRFYIHVGKVASFSSILLEPDGRIVLGGSGGTDAASKFLLVRLNADGSYDHSFDKTGVAEASFPGYATQGIEGLALAPGNKIVAAGTAGDAFAVARYDADGKLDPTFAYGGRLAGHPLGKPSAAHAVVVLSDGRIVLAGQIGNDMGMVRLRANGTYDLAFDAGGVVTTTVADQNAYPLRTTANAIALNANGNIILGGNGLGTPTLIVARYRPNGSLDPSFGAGGVVATNQGDGLSASVNSVAIEPDGKVVAGALIGVTSPYTLGAFPTPVVARFDTHGLDATFGDGGVARVGVAAPDLFPPISNLVLQPGGKILGAAYDVFRVLGT